METNKLYCGVYSGSCVYSEDDNVWWGRLLRVGNIPLRGCHTYEAVTREQLYKEFCIAVDEYRKAVLNS